MKIFFSSILFLTDCCEPSCSIYKDPCLNCSVAEKLNEFYPLSRMILLFHAIMEIAKLQGSIGNTHLLFSLSLQRMGMRMAIVLLIGTMAVGYLPLLPMLIQSAEATATTAVQKCFGLTPTISLTKRSMLFGILCKPQLYC